jgi:PTH1 family peptidyl-tRNA hydrolase
MKVVVGLGNPGRKYNNTRHNIGFEVLAEVARRWQAGKPRLKFEAEYAEVVAGGQKVLLLSPLTYMNASGKAVIGATNFFEVTPDDVLVVCDDFNLPVGKLRFRPSGSAGGQKGLADILRRLGTQDVPRVRVGIGPLPPQWNVSDFVLSRFESDERTTIDTLVQVAADGVGDWVREDVAFCMNRYNGYPDPPKQKRKKPTDDSSERQTDAPKQQTDTVEHDLARLKKLAEKKPDRKT